MQRTMCHILRLLGVDVLLALISARNSCCKVSTAHARVVLDASASACSVCLPEEAVTRANFQLSLFD